MPDRTPKVTFTPEVQALIEKYRQRPEPNPDQPTLPPHPGIFQRSPLTQGPTELSAALLAIQKAFPWLTQGTPTTRITEGLTKDSSDLLAASNALVRQRGTGVIFEPEDFPLGNVLGLHNQQTHDITLRPNPPSRAETLVHELLHAQGNPERVTSQLDEELQHAADELTRQRQIQMLRKK